MPYFPQPFPGYIQELDELRKQTEEEFDRLSRAYADDEQLDATTITAIQADIATIQTDVTSLEAADVALDARLDKLETNQFARVRLNGNQTGLTSATYTIINFNAVDFDPSSIWDDTNKRFKPTIAGYYRTTWVATMAVGGAGATVFLTDLFKNGSIWRRGAYNYNTVGNSGASSGGDIVHFNGSSDYVDVRAYIEGAVSRDVLGSAVDHTIFDIDLIKAD